MQCPRPAAWMAEEATAVLGAAVTNMRLIVVHCFVLPRSELRTPRVKVMWDTRNRST
jgi:hypothetical protein